MCNAGRNYAQAWAFVHFLLHDNDRKHKKRFDTYIDASIEGAGPKAAHEEALDETSLESLDDEFGAYVRSL